MSQEAMKIDVDGVLRQRLAKKYRYIPKWAVRWLARTIKQDELNVILKDMAKSPGVGAADAALEDLGVKVKMEGTAPDEGRYIFVSNHPLGGLDGLCLISCLGHHYNGKIRFIVNDLLMAVKPLESIFLPVNKYGRQSRANAEAIESEYEGEKQMITFPAGLCSRMQKHGVISDLEWRKFIITQAVKSKRDIVPIFFEGVNSKSFYRRAKWRKRLGIKFNFEMIYLPKEMFKCNGKTFVAHLGEPIPWQSLDTKQAKQEAQRIKEIVYSIPKQ